MKKNSLIFILMLTYLGCSNKHNSEILVIKNKCIPFSYDNFQSKFDSHNLFEDSIETVVVNKPKASYRVIQFNDGISITMINENAINEIPVNLELRNFSANERNIIEIGNNKFCIDSLVLGKTFDNNSPSIVNSISGVYKFYLQNNKFIVFYLQDLVNPISFPSTLIMLFDISVQSEIKYIPIGFQACDNINCFDDFNNDGNLDFYYWDFNSDSLFLYNIQNSTLKKSNYYLKMSQDEGGFNICKEHSNWPKIYK
jgi:hypothetical protein